VDGNKKLLSSMLKYVASIMPDDLPKYAMGVGKPADIKKCIDYGYNMFDCVLPTRDARHGRLYVAKNKYVYIQKGIYSLDGKPIENACDCETCKHYTRAYLHHLFKVKDPSAYRLATIHNLRFYSRLMESFRG